MGKKVRRKTKSELADPAFRRRASTQAEVLIRAMNECEKLSKSRRQYILDVADDTWISRFEDKDDDSAFERESRRWAKLRREFVRSVDNPLEIHCFTCHYNASRGVKPLVNMVKHPSCDAGTALRLYWINDPVYFTQYTTISGCPYDDEQDTMRLLRTIVRRFKVNDFGTRKIYFDPQPWIAADDVDLESLRVPDSMLAAIP